MLKKWSIRTTLTLVGLLFVSFAAVVGALALTGLNTREHIAFGAGAAGHGRDPCTRRGIVVPAALAHDARPRASRSRNPATPTKRKKRWTAAQFLLDKSNENWKLYLDTPKPDTAAGDRSTTVLAHSTTRCCTTASNRSSRRSARATWPHITPSPTRRSARCSSRSTPPRPPRQRCSKARGRPARERGSAHRHAHDAAIAVVLVLAVLTLLATRVALRGLIVQPINDAVDHFERISRGDLTKSAHTSTRPTKSAACSRASSACAQPDDDGRRGASRRGIDRHRRARNRERQHRSVAAHRSSRPRRCRKRRRAWSSSPSTVKQNAENARQASQLAVNASDIASRGGDVVEPGRRRRCSAIAIEFEQGRRHHRRDRRHRVPDQYPRAERGGRSGARRRARPRLRGGGGRSAQLAQRSASAAKEIKELIGDSADKVQSGSDTGRPRRRRRWTRSCRPCAA